MKTFPLHPLFLRIFEANGVVIDVTSDGDEMVIQTESGAEIVGTICDANNKPDGCVESLGESRRKWSYCYPKGLNKYLDEVIPYFVTVKERNAISLGMEMWNMALNRARSAHESLVGILLPALGTKTRTKHEMAVIYLSGGK
jgi:hypothetical protein